MTLPYRRGEERDRPRLILTTAIGKSVTIASLTTVAGFAALIPASHRGISSLGWVLRLGVLFILIATLLVLPAILELVGGLSKQREDTATEEPPMVRAPKVASGARRSGMLIILVALAFAMAPGWAAAQAPGSSDSQRLVDQAEVLIRAAGQTHPVDTPKINEAVQKLHEAVRLNPRNDGAYVDLGFCYGVLRDAPTAIEMYMKATQINPSGANFKELADIYLRIGDAEHALMAANAGIAKDRKSAPLFNAQGMALNDLGRTAEAASSFQKAIEIDPNFAIARANLKALNTGTKAAEASASRTDSVFRLNRFQDEVRARPIEHIAFDAQRLVGLRRPRNFIAQVLIAHHLDALGQNRLIEIAGVAFMRIELQIGALHLRIQPHRDIAAVEPQSDNRRVGWQLGLIDTDLAGDVNIPEPLRHSEDRPQARRDIGGGSTSTDPGHPSSAYAAHPSSHATTDSAGRMSGGCIREGQYDRDEESSKNSLPLEH